MKDFFPLVFLLVAFGIPITAIITAYFTRKLQSQERLRAIEKGVPLPEPLDLGRSPWERAADLRLGGLICVGVGLGMAALFAGLSWSLPEFPKGVSAAAAIPFLIGAALLYESAARRRELGPRPPSAAARPESKMI